MHVSGVRKLNRNKLRGAAISLRLKGESLREIARNLNIPRSTLSGWVRNIELSPEQKSTLQQKWSAGLVKAREKASIAHMAAKRRRIEKMEEEVRRDFDKIELDEATLEIFLAGLYLGEGFKTLGRAGFGNSNPKLVKAFVDLMRRLYNIDETKFAAQIFARADQNADALVDYWSEALNISGDRFHKTQLDKRTAKTKTFVEYKGVCAVSYYDTSVQRRILAVSEEIIGRLAQLVRAHR